MRRARIGVVAGLLGLTAACAAPLPQPHPDAVPAALPPVLSVEQVDTVLDDLSATLQAADDAGSTDLLEPRVDGAANRIRTVEYLLAAAGDPDALTPIPADAQTLVVPTTDTWPRTMMVITEPPEDLQAPLLLVLVQSEPRAQYELHAWARLFPEAQTPPTTQPEIGSRPVVPDEEGLLASPEAVVTQYLDVLTHGAESEFVSGFTEDPLRAGIAATRAAFTESASVNGGTLTEIYQPTDLGPYAMATADGGAIVVGVIETTTTITLVDSVLTLGDQTAALLGKSTVTSSVAFTWLSVVAFAVPPAGSSEPIEVLGAEHSRIGVTGE